MKLARFLPAGGSPQFGVVLEEWVVPWSVLLRRAGNTSPMLDSIENYLAHLPDSSALASLLVDGVDPDGLADDERFAPATVRLLPPIPHPPALIDFGLTPRHLHNSALTLLRHELGAWAPVVLGPILRRRLDRLARAAAPPYYKGNHNEIIGDDEVVGWPAYTSYLDIEPELAVVTGSAAQPIAGYVLLNDLSARDVQLPEMIGTGPARCKDFRRGNGLGPYLVTPDEITNPLDLDVRVEIGDRWTWRGTTREYVRLPQEIVAYLHGVFTPPPGTIIGMGTVPDCTGLDHDQWLLPGDTVKISMTGLGTLRQHIPAQPGPLEPSRWRARPELARFVRA